MKIEKTDMEVNKFSHSKQSATAQDKGREIMEKVDEKILEEFLLEVQKFYKELGFAEHYDRVDDVSYSQVYADPKTNMATITVDFKITGEGFWANKGLYCDFVINVLECVTDDAYNEEITKIWRKVLLNHFREQVTPYLKAEKARKQKEIEEEFTFGGTQI